MMRTENDLLRREEANVLRSVPLFQRLSERALATLLNNAVVRTVPRGTTIFVQDEPADRFFLLLDGWVKLYRVTRDGAEAVVHVVAPGETFAEAAMFASASFPVCAEVVADARVLSITAHAFAHCLRQDDQIAFAMLGSLSIRLRLLVQQIEQLQVQSAPQRVGGFLLRFCGERRGATNFELPFDKALIAQRLGMKPETFSRALAKLRGYGVTTAGASVTVANIDDLRDFCRNEET